MGERVKRGRSEYTGTEGRKVEMRQTGTRWWRAGREWWMGGRARRRWREGAKGRWCGGGDVGGASGSYRWEKGGLRVCGYGYGVRRGHRWDPANSAQQ